MDRFRRIRNNVDRWIDGVKRLTETTIALVQKYKDARKYENAAIALQNTLAQITQNDPAMFNAGLTRIQPYLEELTIASEDIQEKLGI
jgi:hypothetical protein